MSAAPDFSSIRNHHESSVFAAVLAERDRYPGVNDGLLPDVACVALNRLPPRYIRHAVDLAFYQSDKERSEGDRAVSRAVEFAYEFVQARMAMRARG